MNSAPSPQNKAPRGRGSATNPGNRFERTQVVLEGEETSRRRSVPTEFIRDGSVSIIARNNSPDIGFDKSVNPYRGCEHGCVYCYARPTHEFLGYSLGLDFETKIIVKENAPRLLEKALSAPSWEPEILAMSGVTDPYQPIEKTREITRRCLAVLERFRNPVFLVTKNSLVERDIDILAGLAKLNAVAVMVSITTLKSDLARKMEPRTAAPRRRLQTLARLERAGIPVGVSIAPLIPGLNDVEMPAIIKAASEAGASFAGYTPIRLPLGVKELFLDWLEREFPSKKERILNRILDLRGGKLNDSRFGVRMRGRGIWAEQLENLFQLGCRKAGLKNRPPRLTTNHFRHKGAQQLLLFA